MRSRARCCSTRSPAGLNKPYFAARVFRPRRRQGGRITGDADLLEHPNLSIAAITPAAACEQLDL